MKRDSAQKYALSMAIVWTLSAVFAIMVALCRDTSPGQIVLAGLFAFNAVIWWINYERRRKEVPNEEKERP